MQEWLNWHAWNACRGAIFSRVRIPLLPPDDAYSNPRWQHRGFVACRGRDAAAIERLLEQLLTGWYPKSPTGIRVPEVHNGFIQHAVALTTYVRDRRHLETRHLYRLFALFDGVEYVAMTMSYPTPPTVVGDDFQVTSQQVPGGWEHRFWHHRPMRRGHTYDLAFRVLNPDPNEEAWLTEESLAFHEPTRLATFTVHFLGDTPAHIWAFHGLTALQRPGTPEPGKLGLDNPRCILPSHTDKLCGGPTAGEAATRDQERRRPKEEPVSGLGTDTPLVEIQLYWRTLTCKMEQRRSQLRAEVRSEQEREVLCERCKRPLGEKALGGEAVNKVKSRERGKKSLMGVKMAQTIGKVERGKRRAEMIKRRERRDAVSANADLKRERSVRQGLGTLKSKSPSILPSAPKASAGRKDRRNKFGDLGHAPVGLTTPEYLKENLIIVRLPVPSGSLLIDE